MAKSVIENIYKWIHSGRNTCRRQNGTRSIGIKHIMSISGISHINISDVDITGKENASLNKYVKKTPNKQRKQNKTKKQTKQTNNKKTHNNKKPTTNK